MRSRSAALWTWALAAACLCAAAAAATAAATTSAAAAAGGRGSGAAAAAAAAAGRHGFVSGDTLWTMKRTLFGQVRALDAGADGHGRGGTRARTDTGAEGHGRAWAGGRMSTGARGRREACYLWAWPPRLGSLSVASQAGPLALTLAPFAPLHPSRSSHASSLLFAPCRTRRRGATCSGARAPSSSWRARRRSRSATSSRRASARSGPSSCTGLPAAARPPSLLTPR